jgi:hypothetical protein
VTKKQLELGQYRSISTSVRVQPEAGKPGGGEEAESRDGWLFN